MCPLGIGTQNSVGFLSLNLLADIEKGKSQRTELHKATQLPAWPVPSKGLPSYLPRAPGSSPHLPS